MKPSDGLPEKANTLT